MPQEIWSIERIRSSLDPTHGWLHEQPPPGWTPLDKEDVPRGGIDIFLGKAIHIAQLTRVDPVGSLGLWASEGAGYCGWLRCSEPMMTVEPTKTAASNEYAVVYVRGKRDALASLVRQAAKRASFEAQYGKPAPVNRPATSLRVDGIEIGRVKEIVPDSVYTSPCASPAPPPPCMECNAPSVTLIGDDHHYCEDCKDFFEPLVIKDEFERTSAVRKRCECGEPAFWLCDDVYKCDAGCDGFRPVKHVPREARFDHRVEAMLDWSPSVAGCADDGKSEERARRDRVWFASTLQEPMMSSGYRPLEIQVDDLSGDGLCKEVKP